MRVQRSKVSTGRRQKSLFGSETDLVINNLVERATLVQESVELDDVRVLIFLHVSMALRGTNLKG